MTTPNEWVAEVPRTAVKFSITFMQLGVALESLRDQLPGIKGVFVSARSMARGDWSLDEEAPVVSPIFVTELESIVNTRGEALGTLRERIMREVASERAVVLISRSPRTAFPEGIGSDVIHDARQIFAPSSLASLVAPDGSELTLECIRELGDRSVIALAEAMWEEGLSPARVLTDVERVHAEALRGAGLVDVVAGELRWSEHVDYKKLRMAVGTVASESVTVGPAVPDTFADLWVLERTIRNAVRAAVMSKLGPGWRENCIEEGLCAEVLSRAQRDSHPSARRMKDLRDPLEWLSTSELLDLRERLRLGDLGLASALWAKLRVEIVPVRNRVAHMRLLSASEARRVSSWRKIAADNLVH